MTGSSMTVSKIGHSNSGGIGLDMLLYIANYAAVHSIFISNKNKLSGIYELVTSLETTLTLKPCFLFGAFVTGGSVGM